MRLRGRLLCLLLAGVPLATATAQSDGDMLPRSLVHAILGFQSVPSLTGYGAPAGEPIVAATVPPAATRLFGSPPNAKLLGSVTYLREVDAFGMAPGSIASVREWFANDMTRRGYRPVDENTRNQSGGGFRDPGQGRLPGFCTGSELLSIDARPLGLDQVEFRIRTSFGNSTCSTNVGGYSMTMGGADLPVLDNPLNAVRYMSGGMGCQARIYGPGSGTSMDVLTTMTPIELIQHYEKQMANTGWTRAKVPSDATSIWVKKDSSGAEQTLMLTATSSREITNCRNVQMMLYGARRDR